MKVLKLIYTKNHIFLKIQKDDGSIVKVNADNIKSDMSSMQLMFWTSFLLKTAWRWAAVIA